MNATYQILAIRTPHVWMILDRLTAGVMLVILEMGSVVKVRMFVYKYSLLIFVFAKFIVSKLHHNMFSVCSLLRKYCWLTN